MKNFSLCAACLLSSLIMFGCSDDSSANKQLAEAVTKAKQGNWESAENIAENLSEQYPKSPAPMLLRSLAFEKNGDLVKATDIARKCTEITPDDFTAQYTLGRLYSRDPQRHAEAFSTLERALALKPGDPDTLILLCNLGIIRKEPVTDKYLNLLKQNPGFSKSAELNFMLGYRQAEQRNYEASKRFMMEALNYSGGIGNHDFIYSIAHCFDQHNFPKKTTVQFYRLYIQAAGQKDQAKVNMVKKRLQQLR